MNVKLYGFQNIGLSWRSSKQWRSCFYAIVLIHGSDSKVSDIKPASVNGGGFIVAGVGIEQEDEGLFVWKCKTWYN